jgi:hypothetical protein
MATLFGSLPSAAMRNHGRSTALVSSAGSGSERALQWVYDDETSNCMHCNTPFSVLTRKVREAADCYSRCLAFIVTVAVWCIPVASLPALRQRRVPQLLATQAPHLVHGPFRTQRNGEVFMG